MCLLTTYRKLCKLNCAFRRTHYWIPTIQDGWDPPSWKSTWRHFFPAEHGPIWIKFRRLVQNHISTVVMCGNGNQMQNSNMADFWANSMACHPRATYHIAGCKNSICHIENRFFYVLFFCFWCNLGFDERRLSYRLRYTCFVRPTTRSFCSFPGLLPSAIAYAIAAVCLWVRLL